MAQSDGNTSSRQTDPSEFIWQTPKVIHPHGGKLFPGPAMGIYGQRLSGTECCEHQHEQAQLAFALANTRGEVSWRTPGGRYKQGVLTGGDLWIVPPGTKHSKQWVSGSQFLILYLGTEWLPQLASRGLNRVSIKAVRELSLYEPLIGGLLTKLSEEIGLKEACGLQIAAMGHCLASRVICGLGMKALKASKIQIQLSAVTLKRIQNYVEAHLGESINFTNLAQEARLSLGRFEVLFKATMEMTPQQYVLRMRLLKAKNRIETGNYTVGQVAYLTGFADHSHLSREFRRMFGVTPSSFLPRIRRV